MLFFSLSNFLTAVDVLADSFLPPQFPNFFFFYPRLSQQNQVLVRTQCLLHPINPPLPMFGPPQDVFSPPSFFRSPALTELVVFVVFWTPPLALFQSGGTSVLFFDPFLFPPNYFLPCFKSFLLEAPPPIFRCSITASFPRHLCTVQGTWPPHFVLFSRTWSFCFVVV